MSFTPTEKEILFSLLEDLDNSYGNAGCNDFSLPPTEENKEFLQKVAINAFGSDSNQTQTELEDLEAAFRAGQELNSMDVLILDYLKGRLAEEL